MTKRILLVDDDPNILDTGKDILEDAGYTVFAADTCAAALQTLGKEDVDLMIADFNLPDGKGVDLAVTAKAMYSRLIIVLMTGEAHVELGTAASAVYSLLTKPVSPQRLIELLKKAGC